MTTTGTEHTLDVSSTPKVPFGRLVAVELRKTADTRAGRWLLYVTGLLIVVAMGIFFAVGVTQDIEIDYGALFLAANVPMGLLVPVIGILAVSTEWGQRTHMVTFSLEPRRVRVVLAKLATGVLLGLASVAVAFVVGAAVLALFEATGGEADWNPTAGLVAGFVLLQVIGVLTGFAFGMLFLNSPVAIVVYVAYAFILPPLLELGAFLWQWFADIRPWFDFGEAQEPLIQGDLGEVVWADFFVSGLVWFALPLAVGIWRVMRSELK